MTRIILMFMLLSTSMLMADTKYIFDAFYDTDILRAQYTSAKEVATHVKFHKVSTGAQGTCYRVFVTRDQYDAGWDALDPAVKAAAKLTAENDMKNIEASNDPTDNILNGTIELLRNEINALRKKGSQSEYTKEEWKEKIKDKTPNPRSIKN